MHMLTCLLWGQRSLCKRAKVGAVITTGDMRRVLSIGYNGPARGLPHDRCRGTQGTCGCLHAEDNAIAQVDSTIPDKAIFLPMWPCEMCAQRIVQANISSVYFLAEYRSSAGVDVLNQCGVRLQQVELPPPDSDWLAQLFRIQLVR